MQTETATYRLTSGVAEATLTSPASRDCLLAGGRPVIAASLQGDVVVFSRETADFMLRARVSQIFVDLFGPLEPARPDKRRLACGPQSERGQSAAISAARTTY